METSTDNQKNSKANEPNAPEPKENENSPHKGHRKRKKKILNAIRELMEFYFGDANLSKDRFLMQLINQDPFVPLDVFLTFNKMKVLATSTSDIAKSLSNSELLELDSEQLKVRRKTALPVDRNVDHKTLYVESLPPTADHDWVKNMFSRFGAVSYISLPKYSKSKKIKEFAFIEFEEEASVEKAVKAFSEFNGVLCMESSDPAELTSVKSFIREKKEDQEEKRNKKRKISNSDSVSQATDAKRSKLDSAEEKATSTAAETDELTEDCTDAEGNKTRKRRHKKKKKKQNSDEEANPDADFLEVRILPKKDWKRLRNKYLNMQRERITEIKRLAWKNSQNEMDTMMKPIEKPTKKLEKMNMNFYGAGNENDENQVVKLNNRSNESSIINRAEEKTPLFNFEPGLIVEVGLLEPCVALKDFKVDMRQYDTVKYVDIKEGAITAFLRLDSAVSAENFVKQVSCAEYNCKVLSGERENEYWEKINQDREAKFNKKVKVPKKRGRERISKIISKHVRFGDDDDE